MVMLLAKIQKNRLCTFEQQARYMSISLAVPLFEHTTAADTTLCEQVYH